MSLEIRPVESAGDLATGVDVYNRVIPERAQSEREVREYIALLPAHVHLLALAEGTPAGLGFVALEPGNRTQGLGSTILTVLPEARGRGSAPASSTSSARDAARWASRRWRAGWRRRTG